MSAAVAPRSTTPDASAKAQDAYHAETNAPISGVSPPDGHETTIMTIWPSIAGTGIGQVIGRLCSIQAGVWIFTVGNLFALLVIPLVVPLILMGLGNSVLAGLPVIGGLFKGLPQARRYTLTNRRVMIGEGMSAEPRQYVELDRFDTIDVVVKPGQQWYRAGDLIFKRGATETFRLVGVRRPETFKQTCMKARNGFVGVKKATG
ncbi:MAG: PH domain-containing protein [Pirellulales bacterium]